MKKMFIASLVLFFGLVFCGGSALAFGDYTNEDNDTVGVGIQGDKNHHNVIVGGDVNLGTNAGGKIVNKNKNTNTNTNTNTNFNMNMNVNKNENKNTNVNVNKNTNKQSQAQFQRQGQSQSLTNEINIEGDTYEAAKMHIQGPDLLKSDAKFSAGKRFTARTKGSVWDKVDFLTEKQAKRLGSKASDAEVEEAVLGEKEYRTGVINKGIPKDGEFLGTLTVYSDGSDVTVGGLEGKAAVAAMKLGATHMHRIHFGAGDRADGDAWNIGIGGGASIAQNGDQMMIAPNGGLGFGSADATNESLPEMVFEIYCDESTLDLNKSAKKQTGNHTEFGSTTQASLR